MTDIYSKFEQAAAWLWGMVFVTDTTHRLYWSYLLIFLVVALLTYTIRKPENVSAIDYLLPKSVFLTKSTLTDLIIYFINGAIGAVVTLSTLIASSAFISSITVALLQFIAGGAIESFNSSTAIKFVFGLAFLMLADFSIFFAHYLHHKIPFLWSFHKTHHSAEVLTPVTAFRFHPVELILNGVVFALCAGPLIGIYTFLFDAQYFANNPLIFAVVMSMWLLTANFRHSHIPLHYPKIISKVLVSPAMHNIHHSTDRRHFDKNFGLVFSIWDRLAGTMYLPAKNEKLEFGLTNEHHFHTAWGCYLTPFRECFYRVKRFCGRFTRSDSSS